MDRLLAQWSNSEHCYLSNATIDLWQVGRERAAILLGPTKVSPLALEKACVRQLNHALERYRGLIWGSSNKSQFAPF